jgi:ribosomal protein S18 acetylase RimI-like enzyme
MFDAVYDEARQRGHRKMHLTVDTSNHHAIAVFENLGWHRVPGEAAWRGRMERALNCHTGASSRGL